MPAVESLLSTFAPEPAPPEREYSALVYHTTTGQVFRELQLAELPAWEAQLNDTGGWSIACPLGQDPDQDAWLREFAPFPYRFSVAIVLGGDTVVQAGPNTAYQPDEEPSSSGVAMLRVGGKGVWQILNKRVLVNAAWNPAATRLTDISADITLTYSLPTIAREIVNHSINKSFVPGSNLPIDLPSQVAGTETRTYHGYEMIAAGQRLQELTQVDQGPDVVFQPYLITSGGNRYVRHRMLIGAPYLTGPGVALQFDYNSSLVKLAVASNSDGFATSSFVRGTGNETGQLYGYAINSGLINQGWPLLDEVDSGHTSASVQSTLDSWAAANIALSGTLPEQWRATVLADTSPRAGEYGPGHFATYNVVGHHWLIDSMYTQRLLSVGRTSSTPAGMLEHVTQASRVGA